MTGFFNKEPDHDCPHSRQRARGSHHRIVSDPLNFSSALIGRKRNAHQQSWCRKLPLAGIKVEISSLLSTYLRFLVVETLIQIWRQDRRIE
jgi:hypothetical protein